MALDDVMRNRKLQRRLQISYGLTLGILELLKQGLVEGETYTQEEIAILCEWEGDAELLVSALLGTGCLKTSQISLADIEYKGE